LVIKVPLLFIQGKDGGDNTLEELMRQLINNLKTQYEIKFLLGASHSGFNND